MALKYVLPEQFVVLYHYKNVTLEGQVLLDFLTVAFILVQECS